MRFAVTILAAAFALMASGAADASTQAGRPCKLSERAELSRADWPVCFTTAGSIPSNGDAYVYVARRGCVAAFGVAADISTTTFELRGFPGGKLIDFEETYDEVYDYCGLKKGRYYRIQVTTWFYDSDYDKDYVESPWIRFKVPIR
jgi:hypothetical protein